MISVILNWLYIGITSLIVGYAVLSLFTRLCPYKVKKISSLMLAGIVCATVYAQIFSLFSGVGILANAILCAACAIVVIVKRKSFLIYVKETIKSATLQKVMLYAGLILLFAYGTSRGYIHFDTGLYHAQSIRWIEEYGVVKGLANLHIRFAYNSAAFPLTALYSFKDIMGQSLHTTAGFFALLSSLYAVDILHIFRDKKILLSDWIRIGLIFYLSVIFSQMISPASDYYAQLLIIDSILLFICIGEEQREQQEKNAVPYALVCLLLVYAVTIKFSTAPMLLLTVIPAIILIQQKKWKHIGIYLGTGILILLPFLLRNILISGWLIYPSTMIDLFSVDWKIPIGQAMCDAKEIGAFGKGLNDVTKADTPFLQWVIPWFYGLKALEKLLFLGSLASVAAGIFYELIQIVQCARKNRKIRGNDKIVVFLTITLSFLFWFLSAPLIRYGYAYIILLPLFTAGIIYQMVFAKYAEESKTKKIAVYAFMVIVIGFLLTRVKGVLFDIARTLKQDYYIMQQDYPDGDATTYEVDGVTIYVPTTQGQIGYNKFPSSPIVQDIELRGDSLKEGFRQKESIK